jgi:hypothetical protein
MLNRLRRVPFLGKRVGQIVEIDHSHAVQPGHLRRDGTALPQAGRRVAVDLEELPAAIARPGPVEAGEEAPIAGRRRRGAERGERLRDAEDSQQFRTAAKMRQR